MNKLQRAVINNLLATGNNVFEESGVKIVTRTSRNKVLTIIARVVKPTKQPSITPLHQERRMNWVEKYMKMNFESVIFTHECRATLEGPDGWSYGWFREEVRYPIVYGVSNEKEGLRSGLASYITP